MSKKPKYLTTAECAKLRRLKEATLAQERFRKPYRGPPYIKDGVRVLYPRDLLEKWLEERLRVADPDEIHAPNRMRRVP